MPTPANPNLDAPARALFQKLWDLRGRTILSGQHDYISSGDRYNQKIREIAGRLPSVHGGDFSFTYVGDKPAAIQHCGPANLTEPGHGVDQWERRPEKVFEPEGTPHFREIDLHAERQALVARCIEHHQADRIITLMWHGPVPDRGDHSSDQDLWAHGSFPESRWQEILTEGTDLHRAWIEQVDRIAGYLKQLAAAGVPVLWRPYHEMNGGWFWWGLRRNPDAPFATLWKNLFHRYTAVHQLNNLIWVWNPNAPRDTPGDEAEPYADYYPGDAFVDVLATDIYHNDYRDSHYTGLLDLAPDKLIALGEVGHLPTPERLRAQPLWSWVMPWGGLVLRFNSDQQIRATYTELDRGLVGG